MGGAQGQEPLQHARAPANRKILGHRQAEPQEDKKESCQQDALQGKLAFFDEEIGQESCTKLDVRSPANTYSIRRRIE